jgi:diguanylate cyclase (GGDEF)-like protein
MNDPMLDQTRRVIVIDDNESIHNDFRTILQGGAGPIGLVDDELALFGHARASARQIKFEIDSALQGADGYEKVRTAIDAGNPYHLAFVDMQMPPGWDGIQTIRKLWEVDPNLHVVICSAYSAYSWKEIAEKLQGTDRLLILKKPFDESEVYQIACSQTAKWFVTRQAKLKLCELEELVENRTAELKQSALVDRLTGLPNRQLLHDRLNQLIETAKRDPDHKFAVLFLDLDRFKVINDSLGHVTGDLLLIGIANRLRHEIRLTDTVATMATAARLGGDEFVIVLDQLKDHHDAVRVTRRIIQTLKDPYDLRGNIVYITASIGITTNSIKYNTPEEMIRDADNAMYRAKAAGKACYMLFDSQMHQEAIRRLQLENDLRKAVEERQLVLHYQPIVSLSTGVPVGFEALVRWRHPERGMISPAEFIPLAEEIGMIVPLGYWVLEEACRQLSEWRRSHPEFSDLRVSVNLSRKQLAAPELVGSIARILREHSVRAEDLNLEITESAIMSDPEEAVRVLHQIRQMNIELHMDDFGTGYSSLSCLHRFPISGLKIDRAFVSNMVEREDYALVIDTIISLSQKLHHRLVAEGVETADQAALLQTMGCKLAQGYYFAKPLTPSAAETFVLEKKKSTPESNRESAAA